MVSPRGTPGAAAGARRRPGRGVALGLFAAIGPRAWRTGARRGRTRGRVDARALAMCLTYYPVTFNDQLGDRCAAADYPDARRRCGRDGLVGLGWGPVSNGWTSASWSDIPSGWRILRSFSTGQSSGPHRCMDRRHSGEEVLDLASAFGSPMHQSPTGHDRHIRAFPPVDVRPNPRDGAANPRPRTAGTAHLRPPEPAPGSGSHTVEALRCCRRASPANGHTGTGLRSKGCGCWT